MTEPRPEPTVGQTISSATSELRAAGIASPRLDAEVLLCSVLRRTRTQLAIDPEIVLTPDQLEAFRSSIRRRLQGESVAYITGTREFMGHNFHVGPGVLVPRPETELLVERAVAVIDRLWRGVPIRVLDLCTGSGAIALSLALLTDPALVSITGCDISTDALAYAKSNRQELGLDARVELVEGDLLSWTRGPWDVILTNPPYLTPTQVDGNLDLAAEPRLALDGGPGGLKVIERILDQSAARVAQQFAMMIEIDPSQASTVASLAGARFPGARVMIVDDLSGRARFVSIERQESPS